MRRNNRQVSIPPAGHESDDLQSQVDALTERMAANRRDIDSLTDRADAAASRADDAATRADRVDSRADAADVRMTAIEAAAGVDRQMIDDLQAAGVLSRRHAAQMEEALRSSRTIGIALGIVMTSRGVGPDQAFTLLQEASSRSNRKIRDLAAEIVTDGSTDIGIKRAR